MLEVEGKEILSQGEFSRMARGLDGSGSGVLQAWWAGEPVSPQTLHAAQNVGARLDAKDPATEELIDTACSRIEQAFPNLKLKVEA
jgi:hypothetical protein